MRLKNKPHISTSARFAKICPDKVGTAEVVLRGKRILITAGPTWVSIDKVRVITNIFKGTLGIKIAREAVKRGARVTLLIGPGGSLPPEIPSLKVIPFKFFNELYSLMKKEISSKKYDIVIHSAAVADFEPIKTEPGKISSQKEELSIKLKPTVKIVDRIKKWDKNVFLVKFKVEYDVNKRELLKKAYQSMLSSNADLMVANDLKDIKDKAHKAFIIDPVRNLPCRLVRFGKRSKQDKLISNGVDKNKNIISCQTKEEIARELLNLLFNK